MIKLRKILLDNHLIEDPRFYRNLDTEKIVETWSKARINLGMIIFTDVWGNSYYNTKVGHKFTQLGERDQMAEMIKELRKRGMGVAASYITLHSRRQLWEHPEWVQKLPDGSLNKAGMVCPNSPYRDIVMAQLKEIVENYDVDQLFLDMDFFLGGREAISCYCEHCKRKFRDQFGLDIPTKMDWNSHAWRTFIKWRGDVLYNFLRECVTTVKSVKDIPISSQWVAHTSFSFETGQSIRMAELFDLIAHDTHENHAGISTYTIMPKLFRATMGDEPYKYEIFACRSFTWLFDYGLAPKMHLAVRVYTIVANGGVPVFIDQIHPEGFVQQSVYKRIGEVYSEVEKREEWLLDIKPSLLHKYAAVYFSEASRDFYGRETPDKYLLSFMGTCKALLDSHIPFDIMVDKQINPLDLSRYKVLILPNAVCLTEEQVSEIREFVKKGGGLVATYKTSLANEWGDAEHNFALSDVLGARYVEPSSYSQNYLKKVKEHPILEGLEEDPIQISTMEPPTVRTEPSWTLKVQALGDTEVIAMLVFPYLEPTDEKWISFSNPPMAETSSFPAIICNEFGKGKVVYFPYRPCAMYGRYTYPEHRILITNATKWAAGTRAPIELEAPMAVEAILWEQPQKSRFIVHLLNYVTETGRNFRTLAATGYVENDHVIQEEIPIHDVKLRVKIPEECKVNKICTAPNAQELRHTYTDDYMEIEIPKIGLWTTVVLELST